MCSFVREGRKFMKGFLKVAGGRGNRRASPFRIERSAQTREKKKDGGIKKGKGTVCPLL